MNHDSNDTQSVKLTGEEVAKHNSRESCWVIIHGKGKEEENTKYHLATPCQPHPTCTNYLLPQPTM